VNSSRCNPGETIEKNVLEPRRGSMWYVSVKDFLKIIRDLADAE
jgi:hypothetical protein